MVVRQTLKISSLPPTRSKVGSFSSLSFFRGGYIQEAAKEGMQRAHTLFTHVRTVAERTNERTRLRFFRLGMHGQSVCQLSSAHVVLRRKCRNRRLEESSALLGGQQTNV